MPSNNPHLLITITYQSILFAQARRRLEYNDIVTSITADLAGRFVPVAADIKKRLESLIERDFLERDPDDRTAYRYAS